MWTRRIVERIAYEGSLRPSLETLRALQRQYLLHVPFENLDIHLGRPLRLCRRRVLEKVVARRRGGWCFELNEVFKVLLDGLGFEVSRCASTVLLGGGDAGTLHPFDHLALIVRLAGRRWLCDVGFGDSALEPLDIDARTSQFDGRRHYRITEQRDGFVVSSAREGGWQPLHRLDPRARGWEEFAVRALFLQTSPTSKFTAKRLCTRIVPEGVLTLSGNQLFEGAASKRVPEERYLQVLRERFGIELGEACWIQPT